jgi:hypothetical protein
MILGTHLPILQLWNVCLTSHTWNHKHPNSLQWNCVYWLWLVIHVKLRICENLHKVLE